MRDLLQFLQRFSNLILFLFLETIALILLFSYNDYQQSVAISSANSIHGKLYALKTQTTSYFRLKEINAALFQRNSELEKKIVRLEEALRQVDARELPLKPSLDYHYIYARSIKHTLTQLCNYITINVGTADSLRIGMGVTDHNGVVGVVSACSEHYAVVIPIINVKMRLSCKTLGSNSVGSLAWHGGDTHYAYLEELPGHALWNVGDTVVTSGFSDAFPEGIPVGVISTMEKDSKRNFYKSKVHLFTDYANLSHLRIIRTLYRDEQMQLESEAMK